MEYKVIQYSLCVWLTTVIIAPAIFIIIFFFGDSHTGDTGPSFAQLLSMYFGLVILHLGFSFLTWLVFLLSILSITKLAADEILMMRLVTIIAVLLTFMSFYLVLCIMFGMNIDSLYLELTLPSCLCIGVACWLFKLKPIG